MKQKNIILILICIGIIAFISIGTILIVQINITNSVPKQLELGNKLLNEGKYEAAITTFNKVIKKDEKNIDARLGLGSAYTKLKELNKAVKYLKEALEIDSNSAEVILALSNVYIEMDKTVEAYELLKNSYDTVKDERISKKIEEMETNSSGNLSGYKKYENARVKRIEGDDVFKYFDMTGIEIQNLLGEGKVEYFEFNGGATYLSFDGISFLFSYDQLNINENNNENLKNKPIVIELIGPKYSVIGLNCNMTVEELKKQRKSEGISKDESEGLIVLRFTYKQYNIRAELNEEKSQSKPYCISVWRPDKE